MNTKNFFGIFLLSLIAIGLTACGDDDKEIVDFTLSTESCEIPLEYTYYTSIVSGNGDYTLTVENNEIIEAQVKFTADDHMPFGAIYIEAKQKGETTLSITDKVTQQSRSLKVKVTDRYLGYYITESNHPALAKERSVYLVNNAARDAYFFEKKKNNAMALLSHGTYEFKVENDNPYLVLHYPEVDGQFTIAAVAPTAHSFNIKGSDSQTFGFLQTFLSFKWNDLSPDLRSDMVRFLQMKMKEESTNNSVIGNLHTDPIPMGILK